MYQFGCSGLHQTGNKSLPEPMIARILSILSHRVSTLGLKLKETVQSWLLTSWDPCCEHNQYEPFLLMVFSGELLSKTWIFVNLTKVLEYLDKYQVLWPSSTSKYQVLLNLKRSSTSKYQVLDNLHQVPSTKYFTWPQPCCLDCVDEMSVFVCMCIYILAFINRLLIIHLENLKSAYCKISNISCTKSQNLNDSRFVLQLSMPNPLKPGVKSRMNM